MSNTKKCLCEFCGKEIPDGEDFCDIICQNRNTVLSWFKGRCAMNPAQPYDTIHEIVPRSVRVSDWWELDNMVPLSAYWHDKIHREGTKKYVGILRSKLENAKNVSRFS